MTNKWLVLVAVAALAISCGGGSTTPGSDEEGGATVPLTSDGKAVSTAVTGTCSSSTNKTLEGLGESVSADRHVREGIVNYVLRRVDQMLDSSLRSRLEKFEPITPIQEEDGSYTYTFTNEVAPNEAGGTMTLSGQLSLSLTGQEGNQMTFTFDGDITALIADWAAEATVDSTTYNEVIGGTMTLSFSGTITYDQTGASTINIEASIAGEDIEVTGDASGTASINITVAVEGANLDVTGTCTGSVTATTSEGTQTCTLSSECDSCS